jgi:hypothetical protein
MGDDPASGDKDPNYWADRWSDADKVLSFHNQARRRLAELKYRMMQEASDWADAKHPNEHEKDVLTAFSQYFSKEIEIVARNIEKVKDVHVRIALLSSIGTALELANSLGNLGKESSFELMRKALKNAEIGRVARGGNKKNVDRRRELITNFVLERPHASAASILPRVNKLLEENGVKAIGDDTLAADMKAIHADAGKTSEA